MTKTIQSVPIEKVTPNVTENTSHTLTVVVLDNKNNPTEGASVSITPSDAQSITNNLGEVQFKLGTETRYQITASYGSKKVTVPYYVTKDGATRLVVNPTYVRTIEKQLHPYSFSNFGIIAYIGIGLGIIILLFVILRLLKKLYLKSLMKNKRKSLKTN